MKMNLFFAAALLLSAALSGQQPAPAAMTAPTAKDTLPVAKVVFDSTFFEFGKARQGDTVRHVFRFTNLGPGPYLISDAKTTCGCTVPEWPKDTIQPGGKGEIRVDFNTGGKAGRQLKVIRVVGNTNPPEIMLQVSGEIRVPKKRKVKN